MAGGGGGVNLSQRVGLIYQLRQCNRDGKEDSSWGSVVGVGHNVSWKPMKVTGWEWIYQRSQGNRAGGETGRGREVSYLSWKPIWIVVKATGWFPGGWEEVTMYHLCREQIGVYTQGWGYELGRDLVGVVRRKVKVLSKELYLPVYQAKVSHAFL